MRKTLMAVAMCVAITGCSKPAAEPEAAAPATPGETPAAEAPVAAGADAAAVPEAAPAGDGAAPAATAGGDPAIRMLRATCPGGIGVQTADGGPVRINGEDATVKVTSPSYYEASDVASGVTVSVVTNPDGTQTVSYTGKNRANGMCTVEGAAPSQAKIALLNATCPGGIEFHAGDGGDVYVNGNEAKLSISNPNYYEAKDAASGVTISVSTDASGAASVSYTGKGGANGICQVK